VHSIYIAEWYNTISNIPFILLAIFGLLHTKGLPHRRRYALAHVGIACIGLGSLAFHATLQWHAQVLLDELPMIWVGCQALYCVLAEGHPETQKHLKVLCFLIPLSVSGIYLTYPNPIFHQITFIVLILSMTYRVRVMLNTQIPAKSSTRRDLGHILWTGSLWTVLGFGIWNVDNLCCESLTAWRDSIESKLPFGIFSQGHAIWHILTALGSNRCLTGLTGVLLASREPNAYEVAYRFKFIPYIRPRQATPSAPLFVKS